MADIVKIAAVAVIATLCALTVKKQAPELATVLTITAGALILAQVFGAVGQARALMDELAELSGLSPAVVAPVIKTVGVAIVTKLAASICRDAGESGVAAAVETAGSVVALAVAIPLLRMVLSLITGLL